MGDTDAYERGYDDGVLRGEVYDDVMVTLTSGQSVLSGTVTTGGRLDTGWNVLVFPEDRSMRQSYGVTPLRLRIEPVSTKGDYEIRDLPAGRYLAIVIADGDAHRWADPAALSAWAASASRFTIGWSEHRVMNLTGPR